MIRVKMLTNVAGTPSYYSGDVVELRDDIAQAWIKEGMAALDKSTPGTERATK